MVQESEKMVIDTRDRLGKTVGELRDLTVRDALHCMRARLPQFLK